MTADAARDLAAHGGLFRAVSQRVLSEARSLSDRAFRALVVCMVNFGPAGIERRYGMPEMLSECAGFTEAEAMDALRELEDAGRLRREGSLYWLVGQLHNDPFWRPTQPNYRKRVQRHIASLPSTSLVREWCLAHPEWVDAIAEPVPMPSESHSDAIPDALPTTSDSHPEQRVEKREREEAKPTARGGKLARARERWEMYGAEGLTRVLSESDYAEKLTRLVGRGVWRSVEEARAELSRVRPWTIARLARDATDAAFRVSDRL